MITMSYGRVEGDALAAMQAAWDDRESFTCDELGGIASYWNWVARDGELFTRRNAEELTRESLDECFPSLTVCGIELLPGDIVENTVPLLFAECVDADILLRLDEGDWREVQ